MSLSNLTNNTFFTASPYWSEIATALQPEIHTSFDLYSKSISSSPAHSLSPFWKDLLKDNFFKSTKPLENNTIFYKSSIEKNKKSLRKLNYFPSILNTPFQIQISINFKRRLRIL